MPRLEYDVVFTLDKGSVQTVADQIDADGSSKEIERLEQKVKDLRAELSKTSGKKGFGGLKKQVGATNTQFAGANQAVFAFSDLVQDSTQFTQGFSQGMRAIGNNVAFAGELFGNLSEKVKRYNANLTEAQIAQGQQTTVWQQTKESLTGVAGAIIAANLAFIAFEIASQAVEAQLKPLREEAKAAAEAFGEVAAEFSEFDTGIPDPFGLRSRSREVKLLREEVERLDIDKLREAAIQTGLTGTGLAGRGLGGLISALGGGGFVFNLLTALGQIPERTFVALEANRELRKEFEKQVQLQEVYNRVLSQNEPLKEYVDLTARAERLFAELGSNVNLTADNIDNLTAATEQNIRQLTSQNDLNDEQIGLLFRLIGLRKILIKEQIRQQNVQRETNKLLDKNISLRRQITAVEGQILGFGANRGEGAKARFLDERQQILQDIANQEDEIRDQLLKNEISREQARTRLRELETQKRLRLEKQAVETIADLSEQARAAKVRAQQEFIGALQSINQHILGNSKGLALAVLALQKALAISEVAIQTSQKAFEATSTGLALAANPATAALAPQAFAQAAAIKSAGAATIAAIAAQGIAEGVGIIRGGSSGGGGAGGGSISRDSRSGFIESDLQRNIGLRSTPNVDSLRDGRDSSIVINIQGDIADEMVSIKAERGRKKRIGRTIRVNG